MIIVFRDPFTILFIQSHLKEVEKGAFDSRVAGLNAQFEGICQHFFDTLHQHPLH